jgi:hypothetical protein
MAVCAPLYRRPTQEIRASLSRLARTWVTRSPSPPTPECPLAGGIAMSGYADAHIRDACLGAGFDAHVIKPGDVATWND